MAPTLLGPNGRLHRLLLLCVMLLAPVLSAIAVKAGGRYAHPSSQAQKKSSQAQPEERSSATESVPIDPRECPDPAATELLVRTELLLAGIATDANSSCSAQGPWQEHPPLPMSTRALLEGLGRSNSTPPTLFEETHWCHPVNPHSSLEGVHESVVQSVGQSESSLPLHSLRGLLSAEFRSAVLATHNQSPPELGLASSLGQHTSAQGSVADATAHSTPDPINSSGAFLAGHLRCGRQGVLAARAVPSADARQDTSQLVVGGSFLNQAVAVLSAQAAVQPAPDCGLSVAVLSARERLHRAASQAANPPSAVYSEYFPRRISAIAASQPEPPYESLSRHISAIAASQPEPEYSQPASIISSLPGKRRCQATRPSIAQGTGASFARGGMERPIGALEMKVLWVDSSSSREVHSATGSSGSESGTDLGDESETLELMLLRAH